jgi:hypothetical protein
VRICFEGTFSQTTVCAAGGTAGCGGGGGLGGTGGGGGGSSIGIFAWNVPIIVKGGTVTAGNGGNGASGGPGGNGAQGGMGGDPPTATCHASCAYGSNGCYNSDTTVTGNAGTVGGVGAAGGMGGAGAGGSSYGIYWAGSTPPSLLSGATAHAGNAGSGSVPGIAQGIGTP